jgi:gliding motility-associated-like protein
MNTLKNIVLVTFLFAGLSAHAQITFFADTTEGCDVLEVTFTYRNIDFTDTITSVEWDFGNGQTGTGKNKQTVVYDSAGTYSVSILLNGNTTISRPGYIKIHATPRAAFFWSDSLELGSFTVVFVSPPQEVDSVRYSYQWQFEDGGSGDTRSLIHRFQSAGDYRASLRVRHPFGCQAQRSDLVSVQDNLDCPNVFTPNEDGKNDLFIVNSNGVTVYNLQVFSRNGVLVYKAEAPILMWDGRNLSGQELLPGTYYYIISPAAGGSLKKTGFVQLYR